MERGVSGGRRPISVRGEPTTTVGGPNRPYEVPLDDKVMVFDVEEGHLVALYPRNQPRKEIRGVGTPLLQAQRDPPRVQHDHRVYLTVRRTPFRARNGRTTRASTL